MSDGVNCNLCATPGRLNGDTEIASVRSNVRAFREEVFVVWRCAHCRSIHARDKVELSHYYAKYPFHRQKLDWMLRIVYGNTLRRLIRAGLKRSDSILDYGCGSGLWVDFLKSKGYSRAAGYDEYSKPFANPAALENTYDFIHCQDVVEHVDDPRALLRTFGELARPGARIVIGTPNADAIDLSKPEDFVHSLHQPYHTHILSKVALLAEANALGWMLEREYATPYTNTLVPCLNLRFGLHYGKCFDDTVDLAFDRIRFNRRLLYPQCLTYALFGYFLCPETELLALFRVADK